MMHAAEQTQINERTQAHRDSLVHAQVAGMLERLSVGACETVTDWVVYDTDKPAAEHTGLPPVKSVLHKEYRQREQSHATVQGNISTAAQVRFDTVAESTQQRAIMRTLAQKPRALTGMLWLGIGLFVLAVCVLAIWIFYKRLKLW